MKNITIFRLGLTFITLFLISQFAVRHNGYSNDAVDFVLGMLIGLGASLLGVFVWRTRRAC